MDKIGETKKENLLQPNLQELSIEKACEEYTSSVKLTLEQINHQLDNLLLKNWNSLDELAIKIAARMNFLEKNPTFLSCLKYDKKCVKNERLLEFDEIRITLKEHARRIQEKLEETERYHQKLLELVAQNAHDHDDDEFQDCLSCHKDSVSTISDSGSFQKLSPTTNSKIKISFLQKPTNQKTCFDRVTIHKSAYSDAHLNQQSAKYRIFSDIIPDVQRRKPMEDLHEKLIQQLVATDSLEGFLKLMDRKPSKNVKPIKKASNLEQKYKNSLYFFPKEMKKKRVLPNKTNSISSASRTKKIASNSTCYNLLVTSSQPASMSNQDKTRKVRLGLARNKLKYYDLLDDIDCNVVQPIKSEYPRRDNIIPKHLKEAKSYLHRMMEENDKVWKKLLIPTSNKKTKDYEKKQNIHQAKSKQFKNLIEYLTSPQPQILSEIPKSLVVMPVKVIYDNFPTKDNISSPRPDYNKIQHQKEIAKAAALVKQLSQNPESAPLPIQKRTEMLDQLRGLKLKNDHIQKNIQKAIDVIETKMIDLLSSPKDAAPTEAFNAMEKEITNVLKMMNVDEKEPTSKIIPEKDENIIKIPSPKASSPRVKKVPTVIKKTLTTNIENQDGDHKITTKKRDKSTERKDEKKVIKFEKTTTEPKKPEVKKKVETTTKQVVAKIKPEGKKAANIAEGERLLGQVDSVIQKIDNIYSKFSDEQKKKLKIERYNNINEFFSGLQPTIESPTVIDYQQIIEYPKLQPTLTIYHQAPIYYKTHLDFIEPPTQDTELEVIPLSELKEQFIAEFSESEAEESPVIVKMKEISLNLPKFLNPSTRHAETLKIFYTMFFTSIFMVLNLDYVS